MITSGFKNAMAQLLSSGGSDKGLLPVKDLSGTTAYLAGYDSFPATVTTTFTTTAANAGVSVGTGNTAATDGDYQLESTITSGLTGTVTVDKGLENSDSYIRLAVELTNTSGSSITVSEIGYKQAFEVAATQGGTTTTSVVCLVDRTVLTTPLTIAAGGTATIGYQLSAKLTSGGASVLVPKSITVNGIYDPQDDSADGYSSVTVSVPQNTLTTKNITQNGTYNASADNYDGYSSVSVNVSGGTVHSLSTSFLKNRDTGVLRSEWDGTSTSKQTSIPADSGTYFIMLTIWRGSSGSAMTGVTNGTFVELANIECTGVSNHFTMGLYYITKTDPTAQSNITYNNVDASNWFMIREPLSYTSFVTSDPTQPFSGDLTIPQNSSDFILLAVDQATYATASNIKDITGGTAVGFAECRYGSYHHGYVFVIYNDKTSDITLNVCQPSVYAYGLLGNTI